VYDALRRPPHQAADAVFRTVAASVPGTSLQSVYNALADFVASGLVRRIEPAGSPGRYELRVQDNHHHLVCTGCGRVDDIDCVVGHAPCLTPSSTNGFLVQTAEVTFWGLCPDCRVG
jgi:Fur family ferric uptake transcriptional regulator